MLCTWYLPWSSALDTLEGSCVEGIALLTVRIAEVIGSKASSVVVRLSQSTWASVQGDGEPIGSFFVLVPVIAEAVFPVLSVLVLPLWPEVPG